MAEKCGWGQSDLGILSKGSVPWGGGKEGDGLGVAEEARGCYRIEVIHQLLHLSRRLGLDPLAPCEQQVDRIVLQLLLPVP